MERRLREDLWLAEVLSRFDCVQYRSPERAQVAAYLGITPLALKGLIGRALRRRQFRNTKALIAWYRLQVQGPVA